MPEFIETVEEIQAEEASIRNLFDGDSRVRDRRATSKYMENLATAAEFIAAVESGRRPLYHLREAMSTSDFPLLFADILDRQLLANYRETQPTFQNYVRQSTVPDLREVKRFAVDGAESVLPEVDELEEYPEAALTENYDTMKVRKYGRRLDLSWEALINDDLDAFRRNPERLARAARRSEIKFVTSLFAGPDGPNSDLYSLANGNHLAGNPKLSVEALQAALTLLSQQRDEDGEPILIEMAELVVPPALEVVAQNIMNATALQIGDTSQGDTAVLQTRNWVNGRFRLNVEPYLPVVDQVHGDTAWYLFVSPNSGRAGVEFAKLRGYEDPALYERMPNARRIGGGEVPEAFEDDSQAWRVRHVFGGALMLNTGGAKSTVSSNGTGTGS